MRAASTARKDKVDYTYEPKFRQFFLSTKQLNIQVPTTDTKKYLAAEANRLVAISSDMVVPPLPSLIDALTFVATDKFRPIRSR
jgi:hypothetical protein